MFKVLQCVFFHTTEQLTQFSSNTDQGVPQPELSSDTIDLEIVSDPPG